MITDRRGFTLIEVISVLVLMGIVFSVAGMGIVTGVQGYLLARENAVVAQKAQLALSRLTRELQDAYSYDGQNLHDGYLGVDSPTPLNYGNIRKGNAKIEYFPADGIIKIDDFALVDQVGDFTMFNEIPDLTKPGRLITVRLTMVQQSVNASVVFETSVQPRNIF